MGKNHQYWWKSQPNKNAKIILEAAETATCCLVLVEKFLNIFQKLQHFKTWLDQGGFIYTIQYTNVVSNLEHKLYTKGFFVCFVLLLFFVTTLNRALYKLALCSHLQWDTQEEGWWVPGELRSHEVTKAQASQGCSVIFCHNNTTKTTQNMKQNRNLELWNKTNDCPLYNLNGYFQESVNYKWGCLQL